MKFIRLFFEAILWTAIALVSLAVLLIVFLTVAEYSPDPVEPADITGPGSISAAPLNEEITLLTWNVGYCALGKDADFILDGGGKAPVSSRETVAGNLASITAAVRAADADICFFQEVDANSSRSYGTDQRPALSLAQNAFALNYKCHFVPFPWPPIGRVNSGVFTATDFDISSAERHSLPCPFSWPMKVANLKRCLLVSYLPVEGTDKQLVLVNFHLEAYDSGEGKIAQTKQLCDFISQEYAKGNYVIAGGDFNQIFPGTAALYPNNHEDLWAVGSIGNEDLPEGFSFAYDSSAPTCRLLNQPYNPADAENTQYYVIDGFIISDNIQLSSVTTLNESFVNSDHNPVSMRVSLLDR